MLLLIVEEFDRFLKRSPTLDNIRIIWIFEDRLNDHDYILLFLKLIDPLTLSATFLYMINIFDLFGILFSGDFPIGPDFNCLIFSLGKDECDHAL